LTPRGTALLSPRPAARPLSTTPSQCADKQKSAQKDRTKISPEANETSKSGSDDEAAQNEEAAFNPDITDPQDAKDEAGKGNKGNPLDASPANPDISQPTSEEAGGEKSH